MTARFVEVICNFDQVVPDIGRRKTSSLTMVSKSQSSGEMRCSLGGSLSRVGGEMLQNNESEPQTRHSTSHQK